MRSELWLDWSDRSFCSISGIDKLLDSYRKRDWRYTRPSREHGRSTRILEFFWFPKKLSLGSGHCNYDWYRHSD